MQKRLKIKTGSTYKEWNFAPDQNFVHLFARHIAPLAGTYLFMAFQKTK
jgi:hypothetical protein